MNRLFFRLAAAALAIAASAGANASVIGGLGGGGGPFLSISTAGLDGGAVATLVGGSIYNSDRPFADIPAGGVFENTFLAAGPTSGQPATLTFAPNINYLSFLWGSPDLYNKLTINTSQGSSTLFTAPGMGFSVTNGDQSFSQYVEFNTSPGDFITSVQFTNFPSTDAFEVANFSVRSAPVPEPETWGLMLFGLGAIGASMRMARRRTIGLSAA